MVFPELKANLQTKACFQVADSKDSLLIVHEKGAENLAVGEFLYRSPNSNTVEKYKVEI